MVRRIYRLGHLLTAARFFLFIDILGKAIGARALYNTRENPLSNR